MPFQKRCSSFHWHWFIINVIHRHPGRSFSFPLNYTTTTVVHQSISARILWVFVPVQLSIVHGFVHLALVCVYVCVSENKTHSLNNERKLIIMFIHRHIENWSETKVSNVIFIINDLCPKRKANHCFWFLFICIFLTTIARQLQFNRNVLIQFRLISFLRFQFAANAFSIGTIKLNKLLWYFCEQL